MKRMMIALMLLAGAAVPALAHEGHEGKQEARMERLDPAIRAKVKATFEKYHEQMAPLRKSAWETRTALKQELASPKPDQGKISQLTEQLTAGRKQMQALRAQGMADLKSQLTPEQYAQVLVSRHGRGHHGRRHFEK